MQWAVNVEMTNILIDMSMLMIHGQDDARQNRTNEVDYKLNAIRKCDPEEKTLCDTRYKLI